MGASGNGAIQIPRFPTHWSNASRGDQSGTCEGEAPPSQGSYITRSWRPSTDVSTLWSSIHCTDRTLRPLKVEGSINNNDRFALLVHRGAVYKSTSVRACVCVWVTQVTRSSTMTTQTAAVSTRPHHHRLASSRRWPLPLGWLQRQVRAAGSRSSTTRHCARRDGLTDTAQCRRLALSSLVDRTCWRRAGPCRPIDLYHCSLRPTRLSQVSLPTRSPTRFYSRSALSPTDCPSLLSD